MKRTRVFWLLLPLISGLIVLLGMSGRAEAAIDETGNGRWAPAPPVTRAQYITPLNPRPAGVAAATLPAGPEPSDPLVPFTYAHVVTSNVPVYASPQDAAAGLPPVRTLGAGYLWVSVGKSVNYNGETWVQINRDEYVRAGALAVVRPSSFHGVVLTEQPPRPFAWILTAVQPSQTAGGPPNPDAPKLKRYDMVIISDTKQLDNGKWYQIAPDQWINEKLVGKVSVSPRPEGVGPTEKWIEVNLFEQTLAAYEGDRMVYATLVSTGLPQWATPEGLTRIWIKLHIAKMSGADGRPDYYFLEDVPWIMYFNQAAGLHGAYWHDRFGYPHSHGCVNLAPRDARWLFDWTTPSVPEGQNAMLPTDTDPGTWVWVHK